MGSWFSSAEEEEEQNEDSTKSPTQSDYDKYVNDNWDTKYKQKCPACASNTQQCPSCPTCPTCQNQSCDYDKYVNDNWDAKYKSKCPACETPDYDKYVNDNWDAKYKSKCPACLTKSCPVCPVCKSCPVCKACDFSNYVKKSEYDNKVNELNKYKGIYDIVNSIGVKENYTGDFKQYIGKWFMIVNRVNKDLHVSTYGRHNGGGNVMLSKSYDKNNDLFTVDPYGHLICYGNRNTVLAANNSRDQRVRCVGINDPAIALHKIMWCYEGGLIKFYADKQFNWDMPGYEGDVKEKAEINIYWNDGHTDQKWDIVVKEGFESPTNISTIEKVIAVIIGLIVLFYICKVIYGKSILTSYVRGGYVNTKYR